MTRDIADQALAAWIAGDTPGLVRLFDEPMARATPAATVARVRGRAGVSGPVVGSGEPVTGRLPDDAELFDFPLQCRRRRQHLQVVVRRGKVSGLLVRPGEPTGTWKRSLHLWREVFRPTAA